ncbi:YcdB/YcdC domain-containing protein [Crassaminicella profunda]|uniref:YcdB/YcdC domain-containing protein n=1 Tax=Crassaminicella profunda TaxID=1286698 RepID=UPI001CA7839D|nr:YcdB/YcdC domain-containing protein [Crassaminicella profunda]QZY54860.1 S-layer homology domain-containing protein [Crassaminicella profunda]
MKKMLTILLVSCLLLGTLMPINGFAQKDLGLEKAIKVAKEKFDIPKVFTEFDYNVYTRNNKKVWTMTWRNKDHKDGNISVVVNSDGMIMSYNFYKYNQDGEKKLPKYSKNEGKKIAEKFIKKIDPLLLNQLKYQENQENKISQEYRYEYTRIINDIPLYEDGVQVEVNSETGEVCSFYRNWNNGFVFPKPQNLISLQEAQKAFEEKLGLELIYKCRYDEKEIQPYLVYVSKHDENCAIDAVTGEKIKIEYPTLWGNGREEMTKEVSSDSEGIQLSPEELRAVKEVSKLLSKEKVEKIARNTGILGLSKSFELSNARLNRNWHMKKDFTWYLDFKEEKNEKDKKFYNDVYVGIDAITGEIKNFYFTEHYQDKEEAVVYDKEASKKAVEKFLKEFVPDKYKSMVYNTTYDDHYFIKGQKKPLSYTFTYTRMVEGIPFRDNYIKVRYNTVTGKITSFNIEWFDIHFPSSNNVAGIEKAYEKMFQDIGLELQYKRSCKDSSLPYDEKNQEIKLVYAVKAKKPIIFDGNTCEILNYDGTPYKEEKDIAYTDIKGHHAEKEIQALADSGIGFEEETFRPDEKVIQQDFFRLFVKTLNYYGVNGEDEKSIKEMYEYLIREGIIKENEKALNDFVTKEDAVKYMIRALKYDEVAKIKGIYKYPFNDIEKADENLVGHITLAYGLGIIKGNDEVFEPKKEISRADIAKMIFNYLNR